MKRKTALAALILTSMVFILGSCSKYDDGPYLSLYSKEKRVQGRWYFTRVKYNDVDSTESYRYNPTHTLEFYTNPDRKALWNAFTWNIFDGSSGSVGYGMWRLNDEKDSLLMATTIWRYPGEAVSYDTTIINWKINRLAYTEIAIERMYDDTTKITWELYKPVY